MYISYGRKIYEKDQFLSKGRVLLIGLKLRRSKSICSASAWYSIPLMKWCRFICSFLFIISKIRRFVHLLRFGQGIYESFYLWFNIMINCLQSCSIFHVKLSKDSVPTTYSSCPLLFVSVSFAGRFYLFTHWVSRTYCQY